MSTLNFTTNQLDQGHDQETGSDICEPFYSDF